MPAGIEFTKMVASGNDFIVIEEGYQVTPLSVPASPAGGRQIDKSPCLPGRQASHQLLAKKICDRKFGLGADGLLVLEKSKKADIGMRIFNADGSEAEMCGNGARCVALLATRRPADPPTRQLLIETKAGIIQSEVNGDNVKIRFTEPKNLKLDLPIKIGSRLLKVNFINTGVPHTVIFVEGLDKIDVVALGRQIRYHRYFAPAGTNVNFVEVLENQLIKIRTYERGVEDETLACGTGSVASALIFAAKSFKAKDGAYTVNVKTKSGEILKVYFDKIKGRFTNAWLEGKARAVAEGVYYVK